MRKNLSIALMTLTFISLSNFQFVQAQTIPYGTEDTYQRDWLHSSKYVDMDKEIFRLSMEKITDELRKVYPGKDTFTKSELSWAIVSYVRMKGIYSGGADRTGSQVLERIYHVQTIDDQADAGDCDELSFAVAGLHRLAGIPARIIGGGLKRHDKNTGHAWLQVFVEGKWINIDIARLSVKGWYRRNLQEGSNFLFKPETEDTGYGVDPERYNFRSVYGH